METLLVYGLVVVFFVLLIPLIYFLMKDPIAHTTDQISAATQKTRSPIRIQPEKTIAYGIIAALFALMCVLTVLDHRTKT